MKNFDSKDTLFIIDGSSFLYRAYYSIRPLNSPDGTPVQAVFGFCRMIKKLINSFDPKYFVIVWDSKGSTVRHDIYSEYKATRQSAPSDLGLQKEIIQEFADIINCKQLSKQGIEADDLMFSLAVDAVKINQKVILVTSDKDLGQVVTKDIIIFDPFKDVFLDVNALEEKFGFGLEKLVFYFSLLGDSSDNIPGVKGIGPKSAGDLLKEFSSLEDLYNNLDKVSKESTREKLELNRENAFLSEKLFKLQYYQVYTGKQDYIFDKKNWDNALGFFTKLGFSSLVKTISGSEAKSKITKLDSLEEFAYPDNIEFILVQTEDQLHELCDNIIRVGSCAVDTETTGLRVLEDEIVGICLAYDAQKAFYVPFGHVTGELQLKKEKVFELLKPIFENFLIKKYLHHAQFDTLVLWKAGIKLNGIVFDTMIAAGLVNNESGNNKIGLKYLSEHYLKAPMENFQNLIKKLGVKNFSEVLLHDALKYAAYDARQTLLLSEILIEKLKQSGFENLYNLIEMPVMHVLIEMQKHGILVDQQVLEQLDLCVMEELDKIRKSIIELVGLEFADINLNSPKQLEDLLFNKLKLIPIKKTTQKTGYSTDYEVLKQLAKNHDVPVLIIRYRELAKLKGTYIEGMRNYINSETNKVHTTFSQTVVATGRLASSDPNLQNIPVDDLGLPIHIRSAFIAPPGEFFISVDYSQIELKVLAYLSQDIKLKEAFLKGYDIHSRTAANIFEVSFEDVTLEQRQVGKRINFSILYGLTAYGLSKDLNISYKTAQLYIDRYFNEYSGVRDWIKHTVIQAREKGYVQTLWGRRRYIPGINEKNKNLYEAAERVAVNTVIQGTAAELMKLGMIAVQNMIEKENMPASIILQIHDELIITVKEGCVEAILPLIKKKLEEIVDWNIPLEVVINTGKNWSEISK